MDSLSYETRLFIIIGLAYLSTSVCLIIYDGVKCRFTPVRRILRGITLTLSVIDMIS